MTKEDLAQALAGLGLLPGSEPPADDTTDEE
jgi:hypothetical protein